MKKLFVALCCLCGFQFSIALTANKSAHTIEDAYIFESIPGSNNTAAFMKITGLPNNNDELIGVDCDIAKAELHTHIQKDELTQMVQVESLEIPKNNKLELKPGGAHIMLIGLTKVLKAGDEVKLVLHFTNKANKEIQVKVVPRNYKQEMWQDKDSTHHHHTDDMSKHTSKKLDSKK